MITSANGKPNKIDYTVTFSTYVSSVRGGTMRVTIDLAAGQTFGDIQKIVAAEKHLYPEGILITGVLITGAS